MLTKFLTSKFSGWIGILGLLLSLGLGTFVTKQVWDYKELQRKAAYCEGRLHAAKQVKQLQDRVIKDSKQGAEEVIDEIEQIKEEQTTPEGPSGCAAERVPDAILRFHGRLRDSE